MRPLAATSLNSALRETGKDIEEFSAESLWRHDLRDGHFNRVAKPPTFEEYLVGDQWQGQPPLTEVQRRLLDKARARGREFTPEGVFRQDNVATKLIAMWGKGSGKDLLSSWVLSWLAFVVLSLRDPWAYFKSAQGEPFDILNIATTAPQAKTVWFEKIKARMKRHCFNQFGPTIGNELIYFRRKVEGFNEPLTVLQLHSCHSEHESWEGKNVLAFVMDEADAFEDKSGKSNAEACYSTLTSSAATRFGSRWLGFVLSFKRSRDGFMARLEKESQDALDMVFDQAKTWEVLPWRSRKEPEIERAYQHDPVDARCRYENIAPAVVGAFFEYEERLEQCIDRIRQPVAEVEEIVTQSTIAVTGLTRQWIGLNLSNIVGDKSRWYFIHGDPGETGASFGLCMCHVESTRGVCRGHGQNGDMDGDVLINTDGMPLPRRIVTYFDSTGKQAGQTMTDPQGRHVVWLPSGQYTYRFEDSHGVVRSEVKPVLVEAGVEWLVDMAGDNGGEASLETRFIFPVVEDLVLEWRPREDMPVDFDNVEQVIKQLCQAFNVYQVTFDSFSSTQIIRNLVGVGINAENMQFTNPRQMAMYKSLRQLVYAGMVSLLDHERANWQVRHVRCTNNVKIEAAEGGHKDLADARAAATYFACLFGADAPVSQTPLPFFNPMLEASKPARPFGVTLPFMRG